MKQWDYIVIGAGHNGLSSACTLSKAGKSVLVVDQRPIIGGLSASHNYVEAAPDHLLSLGAMDDALMAPSSIATDFGLKQRGYDPIFLEHPYGWMSDEGDTLLLFHDFNRTIEDIKYFSKKDAQRYVEIRSTIDFVMDIMDKLGAKHPGEIGKMDIGRLLLNIATDKSIKKILSRAMSVNLFEMLYETFESDAMRGLWAYWSGMFAPAVVQGAGLYIAGFGMVHRNGVYRPKGGMTGLVSAFANFLKEYGGEIRLNSKVEEILVENNTAKGVRLVGGEKLFASQGILANCAPQIALGELLADGVLDPIMRKRIDFIPANHHDVAPFKIDIAAGRLGYNIAQEKRNKRDGADLRKTTFMTGTLEEHIIQHKACKRGEQVDFLPPMYFSILSGADPSIAPEGGDVFYIYANVPLNPTGGGWNDANKTKYRDHIMAATSRFVDGLDTEIGRVETCPQDFIDKFSAPNAAYFHVDMIPTRLGNNRPGPELGGYQSPVNKLYLGSCGNHPTGGVSGVPGKLAAKCALKNT